MRFAADENFDGDMLKGILARLTNLDILRVQDTVLYQSSDPVLLDWLAKEARILLTHDVNTMPGFVYDRVAKSLPVPGVIAVHRDTPLGQAVDELEIMLGASAPEDFRDQVRYVPIR